MKGDRSLTANSQFTTLNSQLPKGYKQTEVGVIPEDWNALPLIECSGKITDGEHITPQREIDGYYLLSARNIQNGYIDLSDVDYVGLDEYLRIRKRCNPEPEDVLISCSGTIGRVTIVPHGLECVMVRSAALIKPGTNRFSGRYIQYALQAPEGQKQIFSSLNQGAQANLFLNHIEKLCIPVPPTIAEQNLIARALSDTDALIESLEQLLAKKRQIKQGAMQELLTGKRRVQGFETGKGHKQTELGMIPEDWIVNPLGKILSFKNGLNKAKEFFGFGTPIVNYMDVFNHNGLMHEYLKGKVYVTPEEIQNYSAKAGDVFFTRTSETVEEIGLSAVLLEDVKDAVFSGFVLRGRLMNNILNTSFMQYCFLSEVVRKQIKSTSSYTTRALTNGTLLSKVVLAFPSTIAEQQAIATILSDMDLEIGAIETKLTKARQLKQGMMHELLTGKIRLIDKGNT